MPTIVRVMMPTGSVPVEIFDAGIPKIKKSPSTFKVMDLFS
jgi:hypothetical protein